jgi:hypothetical protein
LAAGSGVVATGAGFGIAVVAIGAGVSIGVDVTTGIGVVTGVGSCGVGSTG